MTQTKSLHTLETQKHPRTSPILTKIIITTTTAAAAGEINHSIKV